MLKVLFKNLLLFMLLSLLSNSWAQNNQDTNQMLQEINQLRQIQQQQNQQIANQPATAQVVGVQTPPQMPPELPQPQPQPPGSPLQGQLYNTNRNSIIQKSENHPPDSDFDYRFKNKQIRNTPQVESLKHEAFVQSVQQAIPMSPEQIHRLRQIYNASQYAASMPAGTPPRPTATSLYVNLSPGATPPVIRLTQGFVTSLVFLDVTGAPWPIESYDLGDPGAFNIAWNKKDNVLMVQAQSLYTYGNLAIKLRNQDTPVMLTLIPGQDVVDYRVDITVPGYGPNAKQLPIDSGLPPHVTPVLLDVLDGIPPQGSARLMVSGNVGEAWLLDDKMYLRTQDTLLSPGWLATMSSADGTRAYELLKTPMLLISKNGKVIHVKIGGL